MREWVNQGRFILDLQPADYIRYFEEVTKIVLQAGFEGLLILPDEIQQYIEPKIASKSGDPIHPSLISFKDWQHALGICILALS